MQHLTKDQAEFIKKVFETLFFGRKYLEAHFHTGEPYPRVKVETERSLKNVSIFEYTHTPGQWAGHINDSYGVTGLGNDFEEFSIYPDNRSISFIVLNGFGEKIHRTYALMKPEDSDWNKWQDFQEQKWKIK